MWNLRFRASQNDRKTNPATNSKPPVADEENDRLASTLAGRDQPPFFIVMTRVSASTIHLTNPVTNEVIYTVRDTARGSLSSKPDFEFFRAASGDMFVGSIRMGKRHTEVKLPLTQAKIADAQKFTSQYLPHEAGGLEWKLTKIERYRKTSDAGQPTATPEVAVVDCVSNGKNDEPVCTVRLYSPLPVGRIEVWAKEACVEVGGDWNALDEMIVLAYANMELARRKVLSLGPDGMAAAAYTMMGMSGAGMAM